MDYEQPIGRRLSATHLQAEGLGQCRPEPARMECHLFWEPRLERALDFRGITEALARVVESLVEPGRA